MLGNGLRVVAGAVAAFSGSLVVETRGRRLTLRPNMTTGFTDVIADDPVDDAGGLTVQIGLPRLWPDPILARRAVAIGQSGKRYAGHTSPWWYGAADILRLMRHVTPVASTVRDLCHRVFDYDMEDDRRASEIGAVDAAAILKLLRAAVKPVGPADLGEIGREAFAFDRPGYAICHRVAEFSSGARIPCVAEVWVGCERSPERGRGESNIELFLNRTPSLAVLSATSYPECIIIKGCGLDRRIDGPKTAEYSITLSVITPHVDLATDGKEPQLAPFRDGIHDAIKKAVLMAHRAMDRPANGTTIKEAARAVMARAYNLASGDGRYPANARQIMYAARPLILEATGKDRLDDKYFTQTLLPDYLSEHPEHNCKWDVVFDARGELLEPHTDRTVALSTLDVRSYLGERPALRAAVELANDGDLFPTSGPGNRYRNILFVEKEGFASLLEAADIANRFDIAIMSTKGMSVIAAREMLDRLEPKPDRVLVLHDFDVAGFSIFGTLCTDGRRYSFKNAINAIDIGLRLDDVNALDLQSEPFDPKGDWNARARTLRTHGATDDEIRFLRTRRVELNAMSADVFIRFLERKFSEHGVKKVLPDNAIILAHARRVIEQRLAAREMSAMAGQIAEAAAAVVIPDDIREQVATILKRRPELPWDKAVARVVGGTGHEC